MDAGRSESGTSHISLISRPEQIDLTQTVVCERPPEYTRVWSGADRLLKEEFLKGIWGSSAPPLSGLATLPGRMVWIGV